tara:strand:+ start:574 stop:954 length:381 start_codon:yes stop_codon:yes gene_type:complete
MYKFSKTIDGSTITPLDDGVTQTQALPDFTEESKYVRLTIGSNNETSVTLPANSTGFEVDTDLDDLVINYQGSISIGSKETTDTILESHFQPGVIAPLDRKSFTIGSTKKIYLKSATGGDVNIYTF